MPKQPKRWYVVTVRDNRPGPKLQELTTINRFGTPLSIKEEIEQRGDWIFVSLRLETSRD